MNKVESADSFALEESHQSTEQLDKNEEKREKKKSTIKDKFNSFVSPLLLSSHEPLPQNPTRIQEALETYKYCLTICGFLLTFRVSYHTSV